jgi:hypothetical protein
LINVLVFTTPKPFETDPLINVLVFTTPKPFEIMPNSQTSLDSQPSHHAYKKPSSLPRMNSPPSIKHPFPQAKKDKAKTSQHYIEDKHILEYLQSSFSYFEFSSRLRRLSD